MFFKICSVAVILSLTSTDVLAMKSTSVSQYINYAAFVSDNEMLTIGSEKESDNEGPGRFGADYLTLWDFKSGRSLQQHQFSGGLEDFKVSSDGRFVAGWNRSMKDHDVDGAVRIFSLKNAAPEFGKTVGVLGGPAAAVLDAVFSPDSSQVAVSYLYTDETSGSENGRDQDLHNKAIRVFDIATLSEFCWLTTDEYVEKLSWSPDGKKLAAASKEAVYIWNVEARQKLGKKSGTHEVNRISFTADSEWLVVGFGVEGFTRYKVPASPGNAGLDSDDIGTSEALLVVDPAGISVSETTGGLVLADAQTSTQLIMLHRVEGDGKGAADHTRPQLGIIPKSHVLAISKDGDFAALGLQVLDVKSKTLLDLEMPRPTEAPLWAVGPAPPPQPKRPILQRKIY